MKLNPFFFVAFCILLMSCIHSNTNGTANEKIQDCNVDTETEDIVIYANTIPAHDERDTIVGNFTGHSIDTLYVAIEDNHSDDYPHSHLFYVESTNNKIPRIEIFGYDSEEPKLVNEGDLDGNGTCEFGYLPTWDTSQWRFYHIYTLVNYEWRFLVYGDYLETSEWFRGQKIEVAEPGKKKGTVLIHYSYDGYSPEKDMQVTELRDTIVTPSFTRIKENMN